MKLWFSFKDMPELATLSSNEKLNIISDSAMKIYGHWQIWIGFIGCLVLAHLGGQIGGILGAATAAGIGGCFLAPVAVRIQAEEIRKALEGRKPKNIVYKCAATTPPSHFDQRTRIVMRVYVTDDYNFAFNPVLAYAVHAGGMTLRTRAEIKAAAKIRRRNRDKTVVMKFFAVRWRWWQTIALSFGIIGQVGVLCDRRRELPGFFSQFPPPGISTFHFLGVEIFNVVLLSFLLGRTWWYFFEQRTKRRQLREQWRSKRNLDSERVWPPPPSVRK